MTMHRYWLETYGCQMNKAESDAMENILINNGWQAAGDPLDADLVLLNTCSVRKTAEERIWGRIGNYKHQKMTRKFVLALVGCMSQRLQAEILREVPEVDLVIGTFQKSGFISLVERAVAEKRGIVATAETEYEFQKTHFKGGFKAFVPIMHGCNNFCSYCIVPYVRGPEVSRSPEEIYEEISGLAASGVKEITLLGQNVNSYTYESSNKKIGFALLLETIAKKHDSLWIRFMTSHPKDMTHNVIDVVSAFPCICRHIHLPLQHASDTVLEKMNRKYTFAEYMEIVKYLKNTISDVTLTTDILIGFPGETEADFTSNLHALSEIEFDDAFMYYYNPREGTAAYSLEETLTEKEKKQRLQEVIDLQRSIKGKKLRQKTGTIVTALVEEVSRKDRHMLLARTEHNEMAVFPGDVSLIGTFQELEITGLNGVTLTAEIKYKKEA